MLNSALNSAMLNKATLDDQNGHFNFELEWTRRHRARVRMLKFPTKPSGSGSPRFNATTSVEKGKPFSPPPPTTTTTTTTCSKLRRSLPASNASGCT
ncbi:hypothetical protein N7468_003172 [Penicillium chermesinum]|uniref:Uncharacterized protein n=1 Tax=Penicillium chermesinum TaxID=63820 RepID=A0A9W9TRZ9_9EURO|nr:uncharacterized protein N7468_003172 [Penicillium chermesinum]KAJ5238553.1 hypothetical protein N7468_003172 [Penicillium chermesinum]